jgi:predicted RNase H-like HicB family nuclease
MDEKVELYCTQDDDGQWLVWFPHLFGGMSVIEAFDNEADARAFYQEQIDGAEI